MSDQISSPPSRRRGRPLVTVEDAAREAVRRVDGVLTRAGVELPEGASNAEMRERMVRVVRRVLARYVDG